MEIEHSVVQRRLLPEPGSGVIAVIPREELLRCAPLYEQMWEGLLVDEGKYALFLGVGTGKKEIGYALEGRDLSKYDPTIIHCYDISEPPPEFEEIKNRYPEIEMEYFPRVDLADFQPRSEYIGDTRLVSIHGVLDYLLPMDSAKLLRTIMRIRPSRLSMRLCLTTGSWQRNFIDLGHNSEVGWLENLGFNRLREGDTHCQNLFHLLIGIRQLSIPEGEKKRRNLSADYPASHLPIDRLTAYIMDHGYSFPDFQTITWPEEEGPSSLLLFFQRHEEGETSYREPAPLFVSNIGYRIT